MVGLTVYSESVKAEALRLLKSGKSYAQSAREMGVSKSSLKRWHPGYSGIQQGRPRPDREEIIEAARNGVSDSELMMRFNMSREAVQKFRVRNGVRREPVEHWRGPLSEEQVARIGELLDEGYSVGTVAQMTGHAWKTVNKYYPGRQFSRAQITEAAAMGQRASRLYRKLDRNAA